tara:strand:+ start:9237 stop:10298 length:1062 start_codon:yes stop_codon:yes gene_type:complete
MRLQSADHGKRNASESKEKKRRLGLVVSIFIGVILFHLALIPVAAVFVLMKYYKEPEAVFEVPPKQIKIPPKTPEHKMNVAKHEASRPKPTFTEKLVSTRPTEFALPDLPMVDLDQMMPLDPSELISDQVSSMMGSSGIGRGMGNGLLGGGGSGSGMSFFGIEAEGNRIMLLFDVSSSVVNKAEQSGVPLEKIQEETIKLIKSLPLDSRFGMIQFTGNYKNYSDQLVVATSANKENATKWVESEWVTAGTMSAASRGVTSNLRGLVGVLEMAFTMQPDVIWLISDGSFQWRPTGGLVNVPYPELKRELQKWQDAAGTKVPIHFIGFQMKSDDESEWKRIVRRYGGKLKEIKGN